jgi:hypothetical protein
LVSGGQHGAAREWDLTQPDPGAEPLGLPGLGDLPHRAAFSLDGAWIGAHGPTGEGRVWEVALDRVLEQARRTAGRELTPQERQQFLAAGERREVAGPPHEAMREGGVTKGNE